MCAADAVFILSTILLCAAIAVLCRRRAMPCLCVCVCVLLLSSFRRLPHDDRASLWCLRVAVAVLTAALQHNIDMFALSRTLLAAGAEWYWGGYDQSPPEKNATEADPLVSYAHEIEPLLISGAARAAGFVSSMFEPQHGAYMIGAGFCEVTRRR